MIIAPGLTNEDIDGNGHADELYLEFEVWTFLVFLHANDLHRVFFRIDDLHDVFFHADDLLKLHCCHFLCSAVQWVPPWTSRGRSAGKCTFPSIPPWRHWHFSRQRCRASWRQCGRTSCGAATLRPLNAMMGPEFPARCYELVFVLFLGNLPSIFGLPRKNKLSIVRLTLLGRRGISTTISKLSNHIWFSDCPDFWRI